MHQTASRSALISVGLLLLAALPARALEYAVGINAGRGLNEWLIQSGSITSTQVEGLDGRVAVPWQSAFDWLGVDRTFLNAHAAWLQGQDSGRDDRLSIAALSMTGQWRATAPWIAEAGIGGAHLSSDHFESTELVAKDLFMLDFALGYELDTNWQLSLRYRHFSSGYTRTPNPGLDYAVLQMTYAF